MRSNRDSLVQQLEVAHYIQSRWNRLISYCIRFRWLIMEKSEERIEHDIPLTQSTMLRTEW